MLLAVTLIGQCDVIAVLQFANQLARLRHALTRRRADDLVTIHRQ